MCSLSLEEPTSDLPRAVDAFSRGWAESYTLLADRNITRPGRAWASTFCIATRDRNALYSALSRKVGSC